MIMNQEKDIYSNQEKEIDSNEHNDKYDNILDDFNECAVISDNEDSHIEYELRKSIRERHIREYNDMQYNLVIGAFNVMKLLYSKYLTKLFQLPILGPLCFFISFIFGNFKYT